jgi:hypothetical protein
MELLKKLGSSLKRGWEILSTVYSYNSLSWRFLKSAGLIVFGFFNLMASNLLLSYKPDWTFLYFFMAYGSLLIVYGPIHHLIVIPASLKLGRYSWARDLGIPRWGHVCMLVLFFVAVLYFSFFPLDVMTFELKATGLTGSADISPEISCWRPEQQSTTIRCTVSNEPGIASVLVETNGEPLRTDEKAPFQFSFDESDLNEVVGQKSFAIVPQDKNGNMLRRYVQQPALIGPRTESDTSN